MLHRTWGLAKGHGDVRCSFAGCDDISRKLCSRLTQMYWYGNRRSRADILVWKNAGQVMSAIDLEPDIVAVGPCGSAAERSTISYRSNEVFDLVPCNVRYFIKVGSVLLTHCGVRNTLSGKLDCAACT